MFPRDARSDNAAAPHALICIAVRATAWAVGYLSRLLFARAIVATLIIVGAVTVAMYALWIGAILWLATGRFGIVPSAARRGTVEKGVAITAITALILLLADDGRSTPNLLIIALCATGGAHVWFRRDETRRFTPCEPSWTAARDSLRVRRR